MLGKLPVPERPTNFDLVGKGSTALAVCAGGVVGPFFSLIFLSLLISFSLSLEDGPISVD